MVKVSHVGNKITESLLNFVTSLGGCAVCFFFFFRGSVEKTGSALSSGITGELLVKELEYSYDSFSKTIYPS